MQDAIGIIREGTSTQGLRPRRSLTSVSATFLCTSTLQNSYTVNASHASSVVMTPVSPISTVSPYFFFLRGASHICGQEYKLRRWKTRLKIPYSTVRWQQEEIGGDPVFGTEDTLWPPSPHPFIPTSMQIHPPPATRTTQANQTRLHEYISMHGFRLLVVNQLSLNCIRQYSSTRQSIHPRPCLSQDAPDA